MVDSQPKTTPLELNHPLNKQEVLSQPVVPNDQYAAAICSLLYCALANQTDIAHSLSVLSKHTKAVGNNMMPR